MDEFRVRTYDEYSVTAWNGVFDNAEYFEVEFFDRGALHDGKAIRVHVGVDLVNCNVLFVAVEGKNGGNTKDRDEEEKPGYLSVFYCFGHCFLWFRFCYWRFLRKNDFDH